MKNIQEELTIAYAKCQHDLNHANTLIYEIENKGAKEIRNYKEQLEELRHQIFKLQAELNK